MKGRRELQYAYLLELFHLLTRKFLLSVALKMIKRLGKDNV